MSLEDRGKRKALVCDGHGCGFMYREPFHAADIRTTIQAAKDDGWQVAKAGGRFLHYCPDHVAARVHYEPKPAGQKPPPPVPIEGPRAWWQE